MKNRFRCGQTRRGTGRPVLACIVLAVFLVIANLVGYVMAVSDKRTARSRRGGTRIPERAFMAIAMFGGGPGIGMAFMLHRHKTRKVVFLVPFILSALVGIVLASAWAALLC